jgi:hypothetical protein
MLRKFDLLTVKNMIDPIGLNNYGKLDYTKYLITNTILNIDGFITINSIDDIDKNDIVNSLFYLHFISDDQYLYHLDKIILNNGKFLIHVNGDKSNYVHSNYNCNLALTDTIKCNNEISHYNEIIHGNICQALEQTKNLEGDYIEIGVYKGGSALTALNYMKYSKINRKSYFLDTFDGFNYDEATNSCETNWKIDNNHHMLFGVENTMKYIKNILLRECPEQDFELVKSNICVDELPETIKNIVVANIDVDIYDATRDAFNKVAPKIVKGGIIIAEDPASTPGLIGAYYAMEKFLQTEIGKKFIKLHLTGQYFLIKIYD